MAREFPWQRGVCELLYAFTLLTILYAQTRIGSLSFVEASNERLDRCEVWPRDSKSKRQSEQSFVLNQLADRRVVQVARIRRAAAADAGARQRHRQLLVIQTVD